jgi:hypothetical protein
MTKWVLIPVKEENNCADGCGCILIVLLIAIIGSIGSCLESCGKKTKHLEPKQE